MEPFGPGRRRTRMRIMTAAIAAGLLVAGCASPTTSPSTASSSPSASAPADPGGDTQVLGAGVQRVDPAATDEDVAALADAQAAFAMDLYHAVRAEVDGDLVVGPVSLHTALAMTRAGARGQTASEMDDVLHAAALDLHAAGNALDRSLQERNDAEGVELATANRLWVQHGFELDDDYVATVAGNYGAGLAAADFLRDVEAAREAINGWVADGTNDMIEELFPAGVLDASTRLVLVNAIFLDAAWQFPFEPARTSDAAFTLADGTRAQVPTMHYDEFLPTAEGPDWAAVELPYDGEQLSMTVIVPQDLEAFEERLDTTLLEDVLGQITDGGIHLSLPRFTARTHLDLDETLAAMGMPTAFGAGADFSGMTDQADLFIQAVEHEAVVEVDEEGTRAAAGSGVAMADSHGPTIAVDRPFLFLVRDEPTGAILFLGRVTDPR